MSRTVFDMNQQCFLNLSPKAKETEAKINRSDLIRIKSSSTAKETINKLKRQPTKFEKIFSNDMTNKELISKIYKQTIYLITTETNNPILNMGRRPE